MSSGGSVEFTIDGRAVRADAGETILTVAARNGIRVPTLCHHEALPDDGRCRLCVVEVAKGGRARLVTACLYPAEAGIAVATSSPDVDLVRRTVLELLWARCPNAPEIAALAREYGVREQRYRAGAGDERCILCGLCIRACTTMLHVSALSFSGRGIGKKAATPFDDASPGCIGCGSCASVCPTRCIPVRDTAATRLIWGKTFELVACKTCGAPVITKEHRTHAMAHGGLPEDYYDACEPCKQAAAAARFAAVAW